MLTLSCPDATGVPLVGNIDGKHRKSWKASVISSPEDTGMDTLGTETIGTAHNKDQALGDASSLPLDHVFCFHPYALNRSCQGPVFTAFLSPHSEAQELRQRASCKSAALEAVLGEPVETSGGSGGPSPTFCKPCLPRELLSQRKGVALCLLLLCNSSQQPSFPSLGRECCPPEKVLMDRFSYCLWFRESAFQQSRASILSGIYPNTQDEASFSNQCLLTSDICVQEMAHCVCLLGAVIYAGGDTVYTNLEGRDWEEGRKWGIGLVRKRPEKEKRNKH